MVYLLILVLGIAAFVWTDLSSPSTFFNFVLPLVFFVAVLSSMMMGFYLIQRKGQRRESQRDADMRFLAHIGSDFKPALPKVPAPSAGSSPARPGTPQTASLSDQE
jgi:hypothetical protein